MKDAKAWLDLADHLAVRACLPESGHAKSKPAFLA
jgi:hypothetical protein